MNDIIIAEKKDGTIRIEGRLETNYLPSPNPFTVGESGCLAVNEIADRLTSPYLVDNPSGIEGNSGGARRLHGWRGTTNDCRTYAQGWRTVIACGVCRRDKWWWAQLSADQRPKEA